MVFGIFHIQYCSLILPYLITDMVAARYAAIKRRNKPAVPLSLSGVKSIIRTKIVNFRNTLNEYGAPCRPRVRKTRY